MNRFVTLLALCAVLLSVALVSTAVRAQTTLPEEQLGQIRQNCVTAQTALSQLHKNDVLLRNNRGKLYERISTKLMAPLNSRIALGRLGGLKLSATALEYDRQLGVFRADYIQYDESMSNMLKINCTERPVEFYESVRATREKRQKVYEDTVALTTLLQAYKTEFESFVKETEGAIR